MKLFGIKLQVFILLFPLSAFSQTNHYLVEQADNYFKAGRYWDAFFKYRECAKIPEFNSENQMNEQIKNSSRALYLTQKFKDYYAMRKYDIAKENLISLVKINPEDPNRGEIAHITLAQGTELQRAAWRQRTPDATADMLKRAISYYYQAAKEGLMQESLNAIKQCEFSIKQNQLPVNEIVNTKEVEKIKSEAEVASPRGSKKPEVIIIPSLKNQLN